MSDEAKTATRGAKDLTIICLCVSLLSFAEIDGDDPRLPIEERSWLCDRKCDGDLDLDIDDGAAVNAGRDSELESDFLVLAKDEELEAVMPGRSLDMSSLDDLKASSGCGRSKIPPGLPISCSGDVIDGDFQYSLSSPA